MATAISKACSRCGVTKDVAEFGKRARSKDGLTVWCKPCNSAYGREHYAKNREKKNAQAAAWYEANKEARNEQQRAYYRANAERAAEYQQAWNAAHPEWRRRLTAEWRTAHPERTRELAREWRAANLERERARRRRAYAADPERFIEEAHQRRALIRGVTAGSVDYDALWTGTCGICGEIMGRDLAHPDPMSKSVDHIVPLALGGAHVQSNLQYAHLRCNVSKGARRLDDGAVA